MFGLGRMGYRESSVQISEVFRFWVGGSQEIRTLVSDRIGQVAHIIFLSPKRHITKIVDSTLYNDL